jgi:hypothetical protein
MAVPHYTYLMLKITGPSGVITVKGNFELSDNCDRELNKISQSLGMTAEYAALEGSTDHNILPNVGQSLLDQAFDST